MSFGRDEWLSKDEMVNLPISVIISILFMKEYEDEALHVDWNIWYGSSVKIKDVLFMQLASKYFVSQYFQSTEKYY